MAIIKNTNDSKCHGHGGMETPYKCVLGGCINEFTVIFCIFCLICIAFLLGKDLPSDQLSSHIRIRL